MQIQPVVRSSPSPHRAGGPRRLLLRGCGFVGAVVRSQLRKLLLMAAIVSAALLAAVRPSYWRRTVRQVFAREVMSSGVEAIGIVGILAVALGGLLMLQYQAWLGPVGQSRWLGPLFVAVIVRELAPLLVNLVVIARSGSAIAAELALVHVTGEDRITDGQGIDTLDYHVTPRVLALMLSVLCLTLIFVCLSFLSVFVLGQWLDAKTGSFADFTYITLGSISAGDAVGLLVKSSLPAMLTACVCCVEGLGAGDTAAEAPRASRIAVQRAVVLLFVVGSLVSVATYQ